jgi:hypothetical protein
MAFGMVWSTIFVATFKGENGAEKLHPDDIPVTLL